MAERKVLNKCYAPDFDPSKLPRRRQAQQQQMKVRMMLPFSICCNSCGHFAYKGTKFNSRKEEVLGHTYLRHIHIFRFFFKCSTCSAQIIFTTDPQNSDYTVESGATRNFEPWRAVDDALDDAKRKRHAEEVADALKALENRTLDSKKEMEIHAALDEMRSLRERQAAVSTEEMFEALRRTAAMKEKEFADDEQAIIRSVIFRSSSKYVRRLNDGILSDMDDEDDELMEDKPSTKRKKTHSVDKISNSAGLTTTQHLSASYVKGGITNSKPAFALRERSAAFSIKPRSITLPLASKPSNDAEENDGGLELASISTRYDSDTNA